VNLIHTLAAYAKLLAPRLPLSTAVRLTYEHQDDYTALAQDLVGLTGGRVLYGDAVEFLTRCAALVALSARPLNASRWDEAAMKRERAARVAELTRQYVELLPLVPIPEDTDWVRDSPATKRWTRTLGGYSLEVTYSEKRASRWGERGSPAHYAVDAHAPGLGYLSAPEVPKGSKLTQAQKLAESMVATPLLDARTEAAPSVIRGDR